MRSGHINWDREGSGLLESSPDPEHHIWGYGEGDEVVCMEVEFAPGERGFVVEAKATLS